MRTVEARCMAEPEVSKVLELARQGFLYDAWYAYDVLVIANADITLEEDDIYAITDGGVREIVQDDVKIVILSVDDL